MNREVLIICILVSAMGIGTAVYLLGLTGQSLAMAAIFLLCPVVVGVQLFRGVRQFDKDMAAARRQLKRRKMP